jgi:sortase A
VIDGREDPSASAAGALEPAIPTPAATTRPRRPNRFDRPKEPHDWRWIVGGLGRTLIVIGLLLFAFVGYQLWGTGIQTAQAQKRLSTEFEDRLANLGGGPSTASTGPIDDSTPDSTPASTVPASTVPAATIDASASTTQPLPMLGRPTVGEPVARLDIASIGIDGKIVIEGVRTSDLQDGPGHFPETPLPGQFGNAAIAGHRTTYGQPFLRIDEIATGDEIVVTTLAGRYVYTVTGSAIVGPDDYSKVIPTVDSSVATLTLTSCHPKYSSKQRIVIFAEIDLDQSALVTAPFGPLDDGTSGGAEVPSSTQPPPSTATPGPATTAPAATETTGTVQGSATSTDDGLGDGFGDGLGDGTAGEASEDLFANRWFSDSSAYPHVAFWGLLLVAVAVGAYRVSRRARRYWVGALAGFVPFVVVLYFFFENVSRLLPPNL